MLFNSLVFLLYLPVVFVLYWSLRRSLAWQNVLVVAASYVFYGWWDWRFLILIAFTSLCSFTAGRYIEKYRVKGRSAAAKLLSGANITVNLMILGVFKYYNFFAGSLAGALSRFGVEADFATLNIVLPVGISFYTFQALSYSIDVYRGRIAATRDLTAFLAFICFFPQLVAGPIERATNLLPQFLKERRFDYTTAVDGTRQMLWGFFKKVVLADNCATIVNSIFATYGDRKSLILIGGCFIRLSDLRRFQRLF